MTQKRKKTYSAVNDSKLQYTLQSPGVSQLERNHLSGSYSCSKKNLTTPQSKCTKPNRRGGKTIRCYPKLYFKNVKYFLSHHPEAHTEVLYLGVLYVTVQSNPFPPGQHYTGSESFIFSCCHTCLKYDVSYTGDMTYVIYFTAGDPKLFINT